ncbi:MAG: desulfoferrodoxin [Candidatus Nanoarchaeia archaeon]|nr:desulfoferrodoxin [Candidatus Nanoarchaeia archaeon]
MAELNKFYKCEICGNLVSVVEAGPGELVCCGQPMNLLEEKTSDEGKEKHVPVIEYKENKVIVKVGSIPHPMEEKHYIELIQLISPDGTIIGKRLKPTDKPEAEFCNPENKKNLKARILCNIHGIWKN